jgi:hypothetical protein
MREALIICPQHDNAGKSLQHVKHYAELALCKSFGGCTVSSAKGSWVSPQGELVTEPVWQLVAACDETVAAHNTLRSIANYIGHEGRQDAVYVRYREGRVEIIDTSAKALAA